MANPTGKGGPKKGEVRNPKGRPPVLLPALQKAVDENRNKLKELILVYFSLSEEQLMQKLAGPITSLEMMLVRCIQETGVKGDVDAFRKLLEIVFGKLPEDKHEFETSTEEREFVLELRRRKELHEQARLQDSRETSQRVDQEES